MKFRPPRQQRCIPGTPRAGAWLALFALVFLNFAHGLHGPWMPGMGFVPPPAHTTHAKPAAPATTHASATHDPAAAHHHHAAVDDASAPAGDAPHRQHQMPPMCPLCQALHAMGGVLPVSTFVLVRHVEPAALLPAFVHVPRAILVVAASARGPPGSA